MTSALRGRLVRPIVVGLLLMVAGASAWIVLDKRVTERIEDGRVVDGVVVEAGSWIQIDDYLVVRYDIDGQTLTARLRPVTGDHRVYTVGDTIALYIDRDAPSRVTTEEKWASEGFAMMLPLPLLTFGFVGLVVIPLERYAKWRKLPVLLKEMERVPRLSVALTPGNYLNESWRVTVEQLQESLQVRPDEAHATPRVHVRLTVRAVARANSVKVTGYAKKEDLITVDVDLPSEPPPDPDPVLRETVAAAVGTAERYARKRGYLGALPNVRA